MPCICRLCEDCVAQRTWTRVEICQLATNAQGLEHAGADTIHRTSDCGARHHTEMASRSVCLHARTPAHSRRDFTRRVITYSCCALTDDVTSVVAWNGFSARAPRRSTRASSHPGNEPIGDISRNQSAHVLKLDNRVMYHRRSYHRRISCSPVVWSSGETWQAALSPARLCALR